MMFIFFDGDLQMRKFCLFLVALVMCVWPTLYNVGGSDIVWSRPGPWTRHANLYRAYTTDTKEDSNGTVASHACEWPDGIHLAKAHSLPSIALLSYPGSGNTWVRYLIESATGIYTGSIYTDNVLFRGGFKGESQGPGCGCTSVVKMHEIGGSNRRIPWQRAILLMRNPYDAMIAEKKRQLSTSHTGQTSERHFNGTDWNKFVRKQITKWSETLDEADSFFNNTLVIHYEDLKSDLGTHLRTLLNFITANTSSMALDTSEERFRCTVDYSTGSFKRKKTYMTFDPFTIELRALVDEKIRYVLNKLREIGHPLPPYAINYPPPTSQPTSSF